MTRFLEWMEGSGEVLVMGMTKAQQAEMDALRKARDGWSQGSGRQFPTKLNALRALRLTLTERYAERLAEIDAEIAAETE